MMRRLILLAVVFVVLIGTGIITVSWTDEGATIKFQREQAREKAGRVVQKARRLRAEIKERRQQPQQLD